ncbi:MAG: hypothetical protein M1812_003690 [Candelaria pacifica]|nr:MAG: hypothetical protein M1812_003690 [Candelaria pacifica]
MGNQQEDGNSVPEGTYPRRGVTNIQEQESLENKNELLTHDHLLKQRASSGSLEVESVSGTRASNPDSSSSSLTENPYPASSSSASAENPYTDQFQNQRSEFLGLSVRLGYLNPSLINQHLPRQQQGASSSSSSAENPYTDHLQNQLLGPSVSLGYTNPSLINQHLPRQQQGASSSSAAAENPYPTSSSSAEVPYTDHFQNQRSDFLGPSVSLGYANPSLIDQHLPRQQQGASPVFITHGLPNQETASSSSSVENPYTDHFQNQRSEFLGPSVSLGYANDSLIDQHLPRQQQGASSVLVTHGLPDSETAFELPFRPVQGAPPSVSTRASEVSHHLPTQTPPASSPTVSSSSSSPPTMTRPASYKDAATQTDVSTQENAAEIETPTLDDLGNYDEFGANLSEFLEMEGGYPSGDFATASAFEQPSDNLPAGFPGAEEPYQQSYFPSNVDERTPFGASYAGNLPNLYTRQYPAPRPQIARGLPSPYEPITNPYHPRYVAPPPPPQQQPTPYQIATDINLYRERERQRERERRGAGGRPRAEMRHDPLRRPDHPTVQRRTIPSGPFTYPLRSPTTTQQFAAPPPLPSPHHVEDNTFEPIMETGQVKPKRARRRGEQMDKIYVCGWKGCDKAYGQIHHLNEHVVRCGHGPKRLGEEFKDAKEAWNQREKARKAAAARGGEQVKRKRGNDDDDDDENDGGDDAEADNADEGN